MSRRRRSFVSIGVALALVSSGVTAAASETSSGYALEALRSVSALEPSSSTNVLTRRGVGLISDDPKTALQFVDGTYKIAVPWDARDGILIDSSNGKIRVGLPFAEQAKRAEIADSAVVVFDNSNGTYTAPVLKADGSVAITSIITSLASTNTFEYRLALPKGVRMFRDELTGAVNLVNASGAWIGAIATPWARDARGAEVPTRFEIRGDSLIQIVDTRSKDFAYPIVADPWLGLSLIQRTTWAKALWSWSPTLMVYPTDYGRYFASTLAVSAAWAEVIDKGFQSGFPNPNSPTMKVQFDCHFIFVRLRDREKSSWNLDSKLPVTDLITEANYGCNYPVGDTVFG